MANDTSEQHSEHKYWAFISYSHADEKWADWLHKSLETYGVPPVLVGKPSKLGPVPKRAYPVFRDRDELPSSADLGEKLTAALRGSRYLIVICSPRSVASKWVHEEIKAFKSMGREDRVLCLIVDGEPYASDHPEWGLEECFPEPVRYKVDPHGRITGERTEPIAADARKGKDGKANAKLKLLAGMFGVNFSDLKQRDQERAHKRMQMILVGVGVLFIVFTLLMVQLVIEKRRADNALIEAKDQRDAAEFQRSQAVQQRRRAEVKEQEAIEAQKAAEAAKEQEVKEREKAVEAQRAAEAAKKLEEEQRQKAEAAGKLEAIAKEEALEAKKAAEAALEAAKVAEAKAVKALEVAEEQRRLADIQRKRAFSALSIADFNEATKLIEDGNQATALAYLSRALRNDPENSSAQASLLALLEANNWALPRTAPLVHQAPVARVEFSADGSRLLTVSGSAAQLWDSATGKPFGQPLAHRGLVRFAQFSPDGKRVVTASEDRSAQVWDAASGKPVGKSLSHKDWINSAVFSPDGNQVITASQDKTFAVWDAETGNPVGTPTTLDQRVTAAYFSPDGKSAVVLAENSGRLWNLASNTQTALLQHKGGVESAAFSPDGKQVVTGSLDGTAQIWDAATGAAVHGPLAHTDQVFVVQFSPDGRYVATASKDRTARIWEVATGKAVGGSLAHGLPVNHVAFSPNGRWVATSSEDRTVRIWDTATGRPALEPIKLDGIARLAAFSRDGSSLAIANSANSAQIWTVTSGRPVSVPVTHEQYVNWAAFTKDGHLFATASDDRTARIWDTGTGKPAVPALKHSSRVTHLEFSPDGKWLATGSEDRSARIWEVASGKQVGAQMDHQSWVNMVAFSPDGKYLATGSEDRTARIWDAATGKPVTEPLKHESYVKAISFSPDGKLVLTASYDKTAKVWQVPSGQALHPGFKHDREVRHAAFSRDGKYVATASDDRTARVWETLTGKPVTDPLRHDGVVNWVDFSPADDVGNILLISASDDKTVRVWDALTGKTKAQPLTHSDQVKSAVFSPDGRIVVTAPRAKAARVWESASWKQVTQPLQHDGLIRSAVFSPNGSFVATTSDDKTARVWMLSLPGTAPEWLGDLAETVGGYQLGAAGGTELVAQPWEEITSVRDKFTGTGADAFAKWGAWFLADRAKRTISSYSTMPVSEFIKDQVSRGGTNALDEVLNIQPANALALAKLALTGGDAQLNQGDFYSRLAVSYAPENPEVLWRRAAVLQKRNVPAEAMTMMETALKLDPQNFAGFGPDGAEFNRENRGGLASKGWLPKGWTDGNQDIAADVTYQKLSDPPPGSAAALRIGVKSPSRTTARLIGPRVVVPAGRRIVVEGFVRSETSSDLTVAGQQFIEPFEEYGKQFIRTTREWKSFKVTIEARKDLAAEVVLLVGTDAIIDVADIKVRAE